MSLKTLPVASGFFTALLFLGVKPKTVFGSPEQKKQPVTGVPIWSVSMLATHAGGAETITVSVPSLKELAGLGGLVAPAPLAVSGLTVGAYVSGAKYANFYWSADTVESAENQQTLPSFLPRRIGGE